MVKISIFRRKLPEIIIGVMGIVALIILFSGCKESSVVGISTSSASASGSQSESTSCSTTVVDYGLKSSIATAIRGVYSDLAMVPGSTNFAIAYTDSSASTLKIAYWNGSSYALEPIAGDLAANLTWVGLTITPSGIPFVMWTTAGTTVKAAIRSAALGSTGTWSAGVVDTFVGGQTRALRVSASPNGDVIASYVTHATTTPKIRFLYCASPCTSPSSFIGMSAAESIEGANIANNQVSTGISWCKATGTSTYYPAVAYGGTAAYRFAVCQQTNLSSCLTAANWTKQNSVATASLVSGDLLLDPTVDGDQPRLVIKNAATTAVTSKMTGGSAACDGALGAFTTGATLTGTVMASAFIRMLKDSTGKYHVVANDGTTAVKYFNSQTTDSNGAWNTAGVVETLTLQAGHSGADISTSTGQIYVPYGANAGDYNLRVGIVNDYTVASSSGSAVFFQSYPDNSGYMQLLASQVNNIAVATGDNSRPAVAYISYPGFAAGAAASSRLKYAMRSGSSASDTWVPWIVPGTGTPQYPSMAFDSNGLPWIAYYDAGTGILKYFLLRNSQADGSGTWTSYQFPHVPAVAPGALPQANETAVGMYYASGSSSPVVVVIDNATTKTVKAAKLNLSTGNWSAVATIKTLGASGGSNLSVDFDTNGNIVVAFYDLTTTKVNYSYSTDGGLTWSTVYEPSAAGSGVGARIRLNPSSSTPALTYYDVTNNRVYYATCSGSISSCATGGWGSSVVDTAAGVSGLATTTQQLLQTSLLFNSSGDPFIIYPRGVSNDGSLALQQLVSGAFSSSVLHAGANANLMSGAGAINFSVAGWNAGSTINSSSERTTVYVGPGNWLYSTSCSVR